MPSSRRFLFIIHCLVAITLLGPLLSPVLAASPGYLPPATADDRVVPRWVENGARAALEALPVARVRPFDLPAAAGRLDDLIPPGLDYAPVAETEDGHATLNLTTAGGVYRWLDGRALLLAPAAAVTGTLALSLTRLAVDPDEDKAPGSRSGESVLRLQLAPAGPEPGWRLRRPLVLALDMSGFGAGPWTASWAVAVTSHTRYRPDLQQHGPDVISFLLEPGLPSPLEIQVARGGEERGPDAATPSPWRYQGMMPVVADFSGALSFIQTIDLIPGRGGLTPNIDLRYDSAGLNGLIVSDGLDQGPLGLGWTMNQIEITRDRTALQWDGTRYFMRHAASFSLVLDGRRHQLRRRTPVGVVTAYDAVDGPSLKVELVDLSAASSAPADSNPDRLYWRVTTGSGTVYVLGLSDRAETGQTANFLNTDGDQPAGSMATYGGLRWAVDLVTDVHGNRLQYEYEEWTEPPENHGDPQGTVTTVTTSRHRLAGIRYNFRHPAADPVQRLDPAQVEHATRIALDNTGSYHRLRAIRLYHLDLDTPYQTIQIGLGAYNQNNLVCGQGHLHSRTLTVNWIQTVGGDGLTARPATLLGHEAQAHTGHPSCYHFYHLSTIDNGVGGLERYRYEHDGRQDNRPLPAFGRSYYVVAREMADGIHSRPALVTFERSEPCYDQPEAGAHMGDLPGASNCPSQEPVAGYPAVMGALVGFRSSRVRYHDYDGALLRQRQTHFHQDRDRLGRPASEAVLDRDGQLRTRTDHTYETEATGSAHFTFVRQRCDAIFTPGSPPATNCAEYEYGRQAGRQFGNLTRMRETGDIGGQAGRLRVRTWRYFPNQTDWIVNAVAEESWYDGPNLVGRKRFGYDGLPWTDSPRRGDLTRVERLVALNSGADPGSDPAAEYLLVQTAAYDGFGNRVAVGDGRGMVTRTAYDAGFSLVAVTVTNPLGHRQHFTFCGLTAPCATAAGTGLLWSATDANGFRRHYRYDALRRLTAVYRGDQELLAGSPFQAFMYHEVFDQGPAMRATWQKTQDGARPWSTGGVWHREFSDGHGRPVQTQQPHTDWGRHGSGTGREVVIDLAYDSLGRLISAAAPRFKSAYQPQTVPPGGGPGALVVNPYVSPDPDQPRVRTFYDAQDRIVRQVDRDGAAITTLYGRRVTYTENANGALRAVLLDQESQVVGAVDMIDRFRDRFDGTDLTGWAARGAVRPLAGRAQLTGDGSWATYLARPPAPVEDRAVWLNFRSDSADLRAVLLLDTGIWATAGYRRWSLEVNGGQLLLVTYEGQTAAVTSLGLFQPNRDYRLSLQAGASGGDFGLLVWPEDDPAQAVEVRLAQDESWTGGNWRFAAFVQGAGQNLLLDNFAELALSQTRYQYDITGNLTSVRNAHGHETRLTYDGLGRRREIEDPDMGRWTYRYDAAGNLVSQTDARGQTIEFAYDGLNRLTARRLGHYGPLIATYDYDHTAGGHPGLGRPTGMTAYEPPGVPDNHVTWAYDRRGRLILEERQLSSYRFRRQYGYTEGDLPVQLTYPGGPTGEPGERVTTHYWWTTGRPRSMVGAGWYVTDSRYSAAGRREGLTLGNGAGLSYGYDASQRLILLDTTAFGASGGPGQDEPWLRFTYDPAGNVSSIRDSHAPGETAQVQHFQYDALNRLTRAYTSGGSAGGYDEQYTFDRLGNLRQKGPVSQEYLGPGPHALTHRDGRQTFWYDAGGNLVRRIDTSGRVWDLTWGFDQRLARAVSDDGSAELELSYDASGRLVARHDRTTGGLTLWPDHRYEWTVETASPTLTYQFDGRAVAWRETGGDVTFVLADHLGSHLTTLWANGQIRSDRRYDPWGRERWSAAGAPTPLGYRFTGQRYDDGLDFYDFRARYYDPTTGRFISPDNVVPDHGGWLIDPLTVDAGERAAPAPDAGGRPARGAAGDRSPYGPVQGQNLNRYTYVLNNPAGATDPTGHHHRATNESLDAAQARYFLQLLLEAHQAADEALDYDLGVGRRSGAGAGASVLASSAALLSTGLPGWALIAVGGLAMVAGSLLGGLVGERVTRMMTTSDEVSADFNEVNDRLLRLLDFRDGGVQVMIDGEWHELAGLNLHLDPDYGRPHVWLTLQTADGLTRDTLIMLRAAESARLILSALEQTLTLARR